MTRLTLRIFGQDMSVDVPPARFERLRQQWSWCLPESPAQRTITPIGGHTPLDQDFGPVIRADLDDDPNGHVADYRLTTALTGRAITGRSGSLFMFHAAGIADPATGRVAGLVAPSGTGKTTASRTLCAAGFGYITDETLIFNDTGDVMPYPKPLSVIVDGEVGHKSQHGPDELGFAPLPDGDLVLGPLVVLHRVDDGQPARLEPMSLFEGFKAVLPQSSAVPLVPDCLDRLAELARRGGGFHRLVYTEIADAVPVLTSAFGAAPAERDWVHVPGTWPRGENTPSRYGYVAAVPSVSREPGADTRYERGLFVDALSTPDADEVLVLVGDLPAHLQGIGAQMWHHLDAPRSVTELTDLCIELYGEHPGAERLVVEALIQLENSAVVRRLT